MVDDRYVASQGGWRQGLGLSPDQPIPVDYTRRALGLGPAPPQAPPQPMTPPTSMFPSVGAANRADEPWRANPAAGAFTSPIRRSGPGAPQVMPSLQPQVQPSLVPQVPSALAPPAPSNATNAISSNVYSQVPNTAPNILSLAPSPPSYGTATPVGPTQASQVPPPSQAVASPSPYPTQQFPTQGRPNYAPQAVATPPPAQTPPRQPALPSFVGTDPNNPYGNQPIRPIDIPGSNPPALTDPSYQAGVAAAMPSAQITPGSVTPAAATPGAPTPPALPASGEKVLAGGQRDPRFTPMPTVQAPIPPSRPPGLGTSPSMVKLPQAPMGPMAHVQGPDFLRRFFLAGQPPPTGMSAMIARSPDRLEGDRGGNR
jgi:hypothetical protein